MTNAPTVSNVVPMAQHLNLREAVEALGNLASDEDEIYHEGAEVTPNGLLDKLSDGKSDLEDVSTEGLVIGFSKLDGTFVSEGSFAEMLADRLAIR